MIGVRVGHQAARGDAVAFGEFADITKSGGTRRTPRAAIHPRRLSLPAGSFPRPPGECGPVPGALPPRSPACPCGGQNWPEWLPTLVRKALGWRQCDRDFLVIPGRALGSPPCSWPGPAASCYGSQCARSELPGTCVIQLPPPPGGPPPRTAAASRRRRQL